jgi:hypothetical protein
VDKFSWVENKIAEATHSASKAAFLAHEKRMSERSEKIMLQYSRMIATARPVMSMISRFPGVDQITKQEDIRHWKAICSSPVWGNVKRELDQFVKQVNDMLEDLATCQFILKGASESDRLEWLQQVGCSVTADNYQRPFKEKYGLDRWQSLKYSLNAIAVTPDAGLYKDSLDSGANYFLNLHTPQEKELGDILLFFANREGYQQKFLEQEKLCKAREESVLDRIYKAVPTRTECRASSPEDAAEKSTIFSRVWQSMSAYFTSTPKKNAVVPLLAEEDQEREGGGDGVHL